ncbi:hypothetical protein ACE1SV_06360 [Streptomyces sp. E-15]
MFPLVRCRPGVPGGTPAPCGTGPGAVRTAGTALPGRERAPRRAEGQAGEVSVVFPSTPAPAVARSRYQA